jgi:hypothetical protein
MLELLDVLRLGYLFTWDNEMRYTPWHRLQDDKANTVGCSINTQPLGVEGGTCFPFYCNRAMTTTFNTKCTNDRWISGSVGKPRESSNTASVVLVPVVTLAEHGRIWLCAGLSKSLQRDKWYLMVINLS